MLRKTPLILLKIGLVTALAILISGCGTEDPWSPDPERPLDLSMVSGPADTVAYGSDVSFSWTSTGGEGEVLYQYRLDAGSWSTASNLTSVIYENVTDSATFGVRAADAGGDTDEDSRRFWVGTQPAADTTPPTVEITSSPVEGSFVATGSPVTFTWDGEDDADGDNVLFWYSFAGVTSDTSSARTVTYTNVAAADPATFSVWSLDQSGNPSTAAATASFVIKDATILYVDDYLFSGAPATERDQKKFYRDILEGYAFAEWDIALQGMPDSSDLVSGGEPLYSTIVFASDGDGGDGTWWTDIGAPGGASLRYYMESGGKLLAISSEILAGIWNNWPPVAGDFEYDWFGILDTLVATYDSTFYLDDSEYCCYVEAADSVTVDTSMSTWDYWGDFTWAVNTGQFPGLPDSMKIDVAKNGDQLGIASNTPGLRDGSVVLFKWGLDVDGSCCLYEYGEPIAHIFYISDVARSAMLNFDGYSMPLPGMRQTIGAILVEFGE